MTDWQSIDYAPTRPVSSDHAIAMVGCGGIASVAARAYAIAGYRVAALVDTDLARAEALRDAHHPDADVYSALAPVLERGDVDVIDIATHTDVRPALVSAALAAGKHVQSQKPFTEDLGLGEALVAEAADQRVRLAVNQNARYAPHFAYLLAGIRRGALGRIASADFELHWDHDSAIVGTPFAAMRDVILFDFGIHWFDIVATVFAGRPARGVYALASRRLGQRTSIPTMTTTVVDYGDAQAVVALRASAPHDDSGRFRVDGDRASLVSSGASLGGPHLIALENGTSTPISVDGQWMPDALAGTMGELLRAIDEEREPLTSARIVLESLRVCFAAVESSLTSRVVDPAGIRTLPK